MLTRRITVAQFLDNLSIGGMEKVCVTIANHIARHGDDSHIICSRNGGSLVESVSPDVKCWFGNRTWRWDYKGIRRIANYIDYNKFDIIHSHNHTSSYLLRLVLRFCSHRPIHIVHDHHGLAVHKKSMGLYDRLMLRNVDGYIAMSENLHARAIKVLNIPEDRCAFIPNGIEIGTWEKSPRRMTTVVQVANVRYPKGHDIAMQTASIVRQKLPTLKWICIGRIQEPSDQYTRSVRAMVRSLGVETCVHFTGEQKDVKSSLNQADLGVLTSDAEGLPLTLLEYMAEGLPVVTTDVGQCGKIVRQSESGIVVPPRDPERTAAAVIEILSDPDSARQMGEKGRAFVLKYFGVEPMVQKIYQFYGYLLSTVKTSASL